jgi:hypothetical protein
VLRRTFLRCDIGGGLHPEPPRDGCQFDWSAMFLETTGPGRPGCISDAIGDLRNPILAYSTTWGRGNFLCLSQQIGLSCRNDSGGRFFLSRERWTAR